MDALYALAEPRRRRIIELLASHGSMSASDICERFDITAQAISQHLKVLLDARLVSVRRNSQQRIYRVNSSSILEIEEWAKKIEKSMNASLDRLDALLQEEKNAKLK